jgi:AmmeMemoRadiSam system protein A
MSLSPEARKLLPVLARTTLEHAVRGKPAPNPRELVLERGWTWPPEADEARGVFVTLQLHGRLRGCIGFIEGVAPLADSVIQNALSAAFRDPRFDPLVADELPDTTIEVSVLSPLQPVASWQDIEIPRHGVVLQKSGHRSVFLPQVAEELGWDRDQTLTELSLKAGLPADAWKHGATFAVFEAEAIHETVSP